VTVTLYPFRYRDTRTGPLDDFSGCIAVADESFTRIRRSLSGT
jgi:hypothetical protein